MEVCAFDNGQKTRFRGLLAGGSSMVLTCAATTRRPSGNRTQVCIWRLTLAGEGAR
jgi:hypothetical protein